MADGSLRFDTKIDTEGFKKGTNTIVGMMERSVASLKRAGAGIANAFSTEGASAKIRALVDEIDQYRDALYYLEKRGMYFGDAEYDSAYQKLMQAEAALSQYRKELANVDGEQKKVVGSAKKMNASLRDTIKSTIPLTKGIFKLSNMFKLLFLRMVMREVIRSVQEGFKNLAQFSEQANKDMSALKTTTQTLQNSFAAAFAPLLTAVTPILQVFIRHLSDALSIMGQFFAVLFTGATKFTKAKDAQIDYAESIKKTAEEANKALSPIDKLNVVAAGTGGGYQGPSPGEMFEEIEIGQGIIDFAAQAKKILKPVTTSLEKLKDSLEPLGKFAFNNLKNFYNDFLKPVGKWALGEGLPRLLDVVSGLVISINWNKLADALKNLYEALAPFTVSVGKGLIYFLEAVAEFLKPVLATAGNLLADAINAIAKAIKSIPEETAIAIGGAIGGIATALLIFAGATAISGIIKGIDKAFNGFLAAVKAHPLVAIGAGIAAVVGALISVSKARFKESELGKFTKYLDDLNQRVKEHKKAVDDMFANQAEHRRAIEEEYGAIQILADKYYDLSQKENLSVGEKELLKSYSKDLIELIPELTPLIDAETGAYKGTKNELTELIKKTKEYYLVQAAKEDLIETAKELYANEKLLAEQEKAREDIKKRLATKEAEHKKAVEELNDQIKNSSDEYSYNAYSVANLSKEVQILKRELEKAGKNIESTKDTQEQLNNQFKDAETYISKYSSQAEKDMEKVKKSVNDALSAIEKKVKDIKLPPLQLKLQYEMPVSGNLKYPTIQTSRYPAYASGNVIPANYGRFMAILGDNVREPEVVSPVSKIEEAVENVINRRGSLNGQLAHYTINVNNKVLFDGIVEADKEYRGQTGRSAFAY